MQRFIIYFFSLSIITVFNTCKTDFDVTAPYKETTVVYGLLNSLSDTNWIRINKAFLGDGNAYTMAQQPDSINYPDILDVKLEQYNLSGSLVKTLNLVRDSSIVKEPGTFATSPNILYRTNGIDKINQDDTYKLVIYNRETSKTVTAKTDVVDTLSPYIFPPFPEINFGSAVHPTTLFFVKWYSVPEGVAYQLTVRFHYIEQSLINSADSVEKHLDWAFTQQATSYLDDPTELIEKIQYPSFYNFVASQLQPNSDVKRIAKSVDFIFTVAGNELNTYIFINRPPTGVNQNIPQYTNINGGLGVFSTRLIQEAIKGKLLSTETLTELNTGNITGHLGFVN